MKTNITLSIFFLILITSFVLRAQDYSISGQLSAENSPLAYANIILHSSADSTIIKVETSDDNGNYKFQSLINSNYFLKIQFLGYQEEVITDINFEKNNELYFETELVPETNQLDEVVVTALRPLVEVKSDKTVFNVENTINASGNDVFELLRKAPGVIIDNNNNIIVEGKTGVQVYIDGKISVLAGDDLTNYLRSIRSDDVESIEIITQPSSRYDAAGNAGIINIKFKRDKSLGVNGNVTAGVAYGKNLRNNTSLSLNQRSKKSNFYSSYSNSWGDTWSFIYLDRIQNYISGRNWAYYELEMNTCNP